MQQLIILLLHISINSEDEENDQAALFSDGKKREREKRKVNDTPRRLLDGVMPEVPVLLHVLRRGMCAIQP